MHFVDLLALLVVSNPVMDAPAIHDDVERDFVPHCAVLATGELNLWNMKRVPWPVEVLSIGHTIASYQNYGGSPGAM